MKAQTAPAVTTIEETLKEKNSELARLQALSVRDEGELEKIRWQREGKERETVVLTQRYNRGDSAAKAELDRIAAEIVDLERRDKGFRADLAEREPKIVSLRREVGELTRIRKDEERSQRFDSACDAARVATDKFLALYAELTKAAGELSCASADLLTWEQEGARAYERLVLTPTFNPNHRLAAQGWKIPPYAARHVREFFVRGMLPPAVKASSNGHK